MEVIAMSDKMKQQLKTVCAAALATASLISGVGSADAQPQTGNDGSQYSQDQAPPPAPSSQVTEGSAPRDASAYDTRTREADQQYAARYSAWAARYCVDQHNSHVAAGAIIGGLLGAATGAAIGGPHNAAAGAAVGGVIGLGTGAAVGASTASAACPPGYVVAAGAPTFVYGGAYAGPGVVYAGPGWYRPWYWSGGRWVYWPYRYWYWNHPAYWGAGYWRPAYYWSGGHWWGHAGWGWGWGRPGWGWRHRW
jgi:hypothetical protein